MFEESLGSATRNLSSAGSQCDLCAYRKLLLRVLLKAVDFRDIEISGPSQHPWKLEIKPARRQCFVPEGDLCSHCGCCVRNFWLQHKKILNSFALLPVSLLAGCVREPCRQKCSGTYRHLDRLAAIVLMRTLPCLKTPLARAAPGSRHGQFFSTTFCSQTIFREGKQLFPCFQSCSR